jgi:hypothetical protein
MIYLSTTQSTKVTTTTVQNRLSLASEYYTWNISNRNSFEEWSFSPDNFSTSLYYNYFTISIGTSQIFTGSNVTLNLDTGEYHYTVYQTTNQYDLNLNTSLGEIENGILIVLGTYSDIPSFTQSDDDTIRVFNEI